MAKKSVDSEENRILRLNLNFSGSIGMDPEDDSPNLSKFRKFSPIEESKTDHYGVNFWFISLFNLFFL